MPSESSDVSKTSPKRASQPGAPEFHMQQMWQQEGWNNVGGAQYGAEMPGFPNYGQQFGMSNGQMSMGSDGGGMAPFPINTMGEGEMAGMGAGMGGMGTGAGPSEPAASQDQPGDGDADDDIGMEGASQYFGSDDGEEDEKLAGDGTLETPAVSHGRARRPFGGGSGAAARHREASEMAAVAGRTTSRDNDNDDGRDERAALEEGLRAGSQASSSRSGSRSGRGSGRDSRPSGSGRQYDEEDEEDEGDGELSEDGSGGSSGSSASSKEQIDRMDRMSDQEIEKRGLSRRLSFRRKRLADDALSYYESRESVLMLDYTPCICKRPIDLHTPLRVLRQSRRIRVLICVTCYNEDGDELNRTLSGIASNLDAWEQQGVDWRDVAVCVVYDGRDRMDKQMQDYLERKIHVFDSDMLLATHKNNPVTMHLFEKTVSLVKHESQREHYQPLQLIIAVKELNAGKLSSHNWFFAGFCRQVQPEFVFLVDVGTVPDETAMVELFNSMVDNPQVGGVCGEIIPREPKLYNFVEASQTFEYAVSHSLDKAFESIFGFVSVLPGAFSAYRWEAIRGGPLNAYFKLEEASVAQLGAFTANMYLAEDRILCFEIVAKRNCNYTLHFNHSAAAYTDIPGDLVSLVKQRRRWLNGSFMALLYYVQSFPRLLRRSEHSFIRRIALTLQFMWFITQIGLTWFGIGSLFLSFVIIFNNAFDQLGGAGPTMQLIFYCSYFLITLWLLLLALGSRVGDASVLYYTASLGYGLLTYVALVLSGWHLSSGRLPLLVLFAAIATFASYALVALLHGQLVRVLVTMPQYFFMIPSYLSTLSIFAFSNLNDISWGTREGSTKALLTRVERKAKPGQRDVRIKDVERQRQQFFDIVKGAGGGQAAPDGQGGAFQPMQPLGGGYGGMGMGGYGMGGMGMGMGYGDAAMMGGWGIDPYGGNQGMGMDGMGMDGMGMGAAGYDQSGVVDTGMAAGGMAGGYDGAVAQQQSQGLQVGQGGGAASAAMGLEMPSQQQAWGTANPVGGLASMEETEEDVHPFNEADAGGVGMEEEVDGEEEGGEEEGEDETSSSEEDESSSEDEEDSVEVEDMSAEQKLRRLAALEEERTTQAEEARRRSALDHERREMERDFASFRTRTLSLWLGTNWIYISIILAFDGLIEWFAVAIAFVIFYSLMVRTIGSMLYSLEKAFKWCWGRCCGRCCPGICCWEAHRMTRKKEAYRSNRKRGIVGGESDDDSDSYFSGDTGDDAGAWARPEAFEDYYGGGDLELPPGGGDSPLPIDQVFSKEALTQPAEPAAVPGEYEESKEAYDPQVHGMAVEDAAEDEPVTDLTAALGRGKRTAEGVLNKIKNVGDEKAAIDVKGGSQQNGGEEQEGTIDISAALNRGKRTTTGVLAKIRRVGSDGNLEIEEGKGKRSGKSGGASAKSKKKEKSSASQLEEEGTIDISAALNRGKRTTTGVLAKIRRVGSDGNLEIEEGTGKGTGATTSGRSKKSKKKGRRRSSAAMAAAASPQEEEGVIDLTAALGRGKRTTKGVLAKIQRVGSKRVLVMELEESEGKQGKPPKKSKKHKGKHKGKGKRRSSAAAGRKAAEAATEAAGRGASSPKKSSPLRPAVVVPVGTDSPGSPERSIESNTGRWESAAASGEVSVQMDPVAALMAGSHVDDGGAAGGSPRAGQARDEVESSVVDVHEVKDVTNELELGS